MIVLSYGLPKSASTFCYRLTQDILNAVGQDQEALRRDLPAAWCKTFVADFSAWPLSEVANALPQDGILVVKTHSGPPSGVCAMIEAGLVKVTVTHRDPRDAAVAVLDAGAQQRAAGQTKETFHRIVSMRQAVDLVAGNLFALKEWMAVDGVLPIAFREVADDLPEVVERIADYLGVPTRPDAVISSYISGEKRIPKFNMGVSGRYRTHMTLMQRWHATRTFRNVLGSRIFREICLT